MRISRTQASLILSSMLALFGCGGASDSFTDTVGSSSSESLLYVASGACYAGGAAMSAGSSTVTTFNTVTGELDHVVVDYNTFSPGDSPISIADYDETRILVLVENAGGRRIDLVNKDGSGLSTYLVNATALSAAMRSLAILPDKSLLVSKSSAIEKFSPAKARITQGAAAYINAPSGACAASTTLISSVKALPTGKILYSHAAVSPNNRIGLISATGYASASDCLATTSAPTATAMPTSLLVHSTGVLLAAYGSTTAASNFIYGYEVDDATNTIINSTAAFSDTAIVNGPSAMAEDTSTGEVYVANGSSAFNSIEKFILNPLSKTLSRASTRSFLGPQVYTRCVTDMKVLAK